jgi:hypothetical protein
MWMENNDCSMKNIEMEKGELGGWMGMSMCVPSMR